jgi:hypothetical protein
MLYCEKLPPIAMQVDRRVLIFCTPPPPVGVAGAGVPINGLAIVARVGARSPVK